MEQAWSVIGPDEPSAAPAPPAFSGSFLTRDYSVYWGGSLVTHMSFQMQTIVLGWHVLQATDSAFWVGMVGGAYGLPLLLLAPFVGIMADRSRRQNLIAIALSGAGGAIALVALLVALGVDMPWHVVALSFFVGSGFTLYAPARLALLPNLLPPGALLRASTIEYSSTRVVGFLGPVVAGLLVDVVGIWRTLLVQVGMFFLAAWLFLRTGRALPAMLDASRPPFRPLRSVQDAWGYLRSDPPLFALFNLGVVVVPLGMAHMKLLPVFARDVLGTGASALGMMVGLVSLGTALSGFVIAVLGERFAKGPAVLISAFAYGVTLAGLGLSRSLTLALASLFALGVLSGVFLTLTNVLLQSRPKDSVRGRIMALYGMVWGSVPLFTLVAGVFAEFVGVANVIVALGTLCAGACVVLAIRGSALREL